MNILSRKVKSAARIWKAEGWVGVKERAAQLQQERQTEKLYRRWIRKNEISTVEDRRQIRQRIAEFRHQPLISVVMPVYNVEEKWLRRCIESVLDQIYENWELCIADDCSPSPHVRRVIEEYAIRDTRIKVVFRLENGHISAASNSALALADGEFCALLDHDDELAELALYHVAKEINDFLATEMIYSDEDMIDEKGRRYSPKFKPDWSRDLFYSLNLITHLSVYRTAVLRKIGGFRIGLEGSQDYDLALRVIEQIPENHIRHIPHILYHWRAISGSLALNSDEKPYAHERAREAIRSHLERTGKRAQVTPTVYNLHRVRYDLPSPLPKVSLITLERESLAATTNAVKILLAETDYQNVEVALVCSAHTKEKFDSENVNRNVKTIVCEEASEAEKYNCAVRQTDGEVLCFINGNLRPASKDWLQELVGFALQTEIGAAGAKITNANRVVLHGGLVLDGDGSTRSAHHGLPDDDPGTMGRAQVIGNFSATTIDCLATRRKVFLAAGGFDAEHLPNKLFDVDFCLKLREQNLRIVWTPYAELIKINGRKPLNLQKKATAVERDFFKRKWQSSIAADPFYRDLKV